MQFKVPKKFVSIISLIFSALNFFSDSGSCIPVQKTQISTVCNFSIIFSKTSLVLDSSFTSRGNAWIFELFLLDEEIKEAINSGATENKLSELAFTEGHKLSDSGYALVQKGITSVDEILRITSEK